MSGTPLTYKAYINGLRGKMREAVKQTQRYDAEWNRINEDIKDLFVREDASRAQRGELPLTDLTKAQRKSDSLPLKEAFAAGNWWRDKAMYLATVLQAEMMCTQEVGTGWHSGSQSS